MSAARALLTCGMILIMCGCAIVKAPITTRVALLAPFEGRYREVGYNALYAARLAFADSSIMSIELLAVDDGGTPNALLTALVRSRSTHR